MRHLLRVADLADGEVDRILARADELAAGASPRSGLAPSVALVFLSSSLRTRVGFAVAAQRLGARTVEVHEPRWTPAMSDGESFGDTLRTVSGMVDLVVCRTPFPLDRATVEACAVAPVVNGGDAGGEHPTQALIDLAALRRRGPVGGLSIGIVGDLSARTARSLLALLEREPPAELRLIGPEVPDEATVGPALAGRCQRTPELDLAGLDVLYLVGLPAQIGDVHLDAAERARWALTAERAAELPAHAVVLSPLPVVDELAPEVRGDPRVQAFAQSDHGVHVRAATLELVLAGE
ncbi:MAG: hypothetical protein U0P45_14070 [Acidimicrobiales bacterium]